MTTVTLKRYKTGRYGLTVGPVRTIFTSCRTPTAASTFDLLDDNEEIVGTANRVPLPHPVMQALDMIEDGEPPLNPYEEIIEELRR